MQWRSGIAHHSLKTPIPASSRRHRICSLSLARSLLLISQDASQHDTHEHTLSPSDSPLVSGESVKRPSPVTSDDEELANIHDPTRMLGPPKVDFDVESTEEEEEEDDDENEDEAEAPVPKKGTSVKENKAAASKDDDKLPPVPPPPPMPPPLFSL